MGNGSAEYPVVVRDIGDDGFELGAVIGSKWVPFGRKNRGYLDTLSDTEEHADGCECGDHAVTDDTDPPVPTGDAESGEVQS